MDSEDSFAQEGSNGQHGDFTVALLRGHGDGIGHDYFAKGALCHPVDRVLGEHGVVSDVVGGTRRTEKAVVPTLTIKKGQVFEVGWGPRSWGWEPDSA